MVLPLLEKANNIYTYIFLPPVSCVYPCWICVREEEVDIYLVACNKKNREREELSKKLQKEWSFNFSFWIGTVFPNCS